MSTKAITIANDDDAWGYIQRALQSEYENDIVELNFDSWPVFKINIKGERYNSTLPTSLMRSLVDLQSHLNKVYAEVMYGKSAKVLTQEERNALEIVFKVEQGSSNVIADLGGFFSELGRNAMDRMTGRQILTAVLGTACLLASAAAYETYTSHEQKTQTEQNRAQVTQQLIASQTRLAEINAETVATFGNILKNTKGADSVTTQGGATFTASEIESISRQERAQSQLVRMDGEYRITSLKIKPDSYLIEVTRSDDGHTFRTELFKGHLNMAEMNSITSAFTNETSVHLNIVARRSEDAVSAAHIVGVNNAANGEQVASNDLTRKPSN